MADCQFLVTVTPRSGFFSDKYSATDSSILLVVTQYPRMAVREAEGATKGLQSRDQSSTRIAWVRFVPRRQRQDVARPVPWTALPGRGHRAGLRPSRRSTSRIGTESLLYSRLNCDASSRRLGIPLCVKSPARRSRRASCSRSCF